LLIQDGVVEACFNFLFTTLAFYIIGKTDIRLAYMAIGCILLANALRLLSHAWVWAVFLSSNWSSSWEAYQKEIKIIGGTFFGALLGTGMASRSCM
jgi:hypothetical protein